MAGAPSCPGWLSLQMVRHESVIIHCIDLFNSAFRYMHVDTVSSVRAEICRLHRVRFFIMVCLDTRCGGNNIGM